MDQEQESTIALPSEETIERAISEAVSNETPNESVEGQVPVTFMDEHHFENLKEFVGDRAADGKLTHEEIDEIITEIKGSQQSHGWLTKQQTAELKAFARVRTAEGLVATGKKLPWGLRIFAGLVAANSILSILSIIGAALLLFLGLQNGTVDGSELKEGLEATAKHIGALTMTEVVMLIVDVVLHAVNAIISIVLAVRLALNKRAGASQTAHVVIALTIIAMIVQSMTTGISEALIAPAVSLVILIALDSYLNPNLSAERKLDRKLRELDTENRAETGTLGLDLEGKGYIRLDFFNLFWLFVVGCFLGLIVEIIWHMVVVDPGVYQDRAGLLYGPFSPIYGCGALLMTLALNRHRSANIILIFVACTIIGGAFEWFVSYWMETAFGIIAWDYHGYFLGDLLGGRTCLMFSSMFGLLGVLWIKLILPMLLKLINKIPWKARYVVTSICAVLMLVDCVMTIQAIDCWYERAAGKEVTTPVQQFYDENYDDEWMQNRFQTMDLDPSRSAHS